MYSTLSEHIERPCVYKLQFSSESKHNKILLALLIFENRNQEIKHRKRKLIKYNFFIISVFSTSLLQMNEEDTY